MGDFVKLHRNHFDINTFFARALEEDLADGDHTSLATIPARLRGKMKLLVKEPGILAGVEAAASLLKFHDKRSIVRITIPDGKRITRGDIALEVTGNARHLLSCERLLLNISQRMSGIATHTARLQALCKGTKARVTDTRKTTPGFRFFEKWAVHIGGGANHRFGLYDMILIKDNHVDLSGSIRRAIGKSQEYLRTHGLDIPIEVETRSLDDVRQALDSGGVQRIMLDNFSVADTRRAVKLIGVSAEIESSGGITEKNIAAYAGCGVDFISVGALTHQVRSLDLSLKVMI